MESFAEKAHHEFKLKEFELLRKEIEYRTAGQERVERNVVIAIIAIYAWLALLDTSKLQPPIQDVYPYLYWLPFLIVVMGAARFWDDHNVISNIGRYIARQEKIVNSPDGGGENSPEHFKPAKYGPVTSWFLRKGGWFLLLVGTAAVGVYSVI
jgi:hypothetical protein